ncbi:AsnC family transcriptional regulator [Pelomicrobium sp. G1]|jgi:DNA-binding Lrp family transcriptional regulator|nr:MAG: hypothetical protein KatS3mg123_1103 [Burkholderiales bacterium]
MPTVELDAIDRKILEILQWQARIPNVKYNTALPLPHD